MKRPMTALRHAQLVYKRAPKGSKRAALKALQKARHDQMRAERAAREAAKMKAAA